MKLSDIVLGIDLGNTITCKRDGKTVPQDQSFRVIRDLRSKIKAVYIVSRVTDEQSLRAYKFFNDFNFFEGTGLTPNKVRFCYERHEKAPIVRELGITHFIDDRPEVLVYMPNVMKFSMNPDPDDLARFSSILGEDHMSVKDWGDIERFFKRYYDA
jgi:hypothetical protein